MHTSGSMSWPVPNEVARFSQRAIKDVAHSAREPDADLQIHTVALRRMISALLLSPAMLCRDAISIVA